MEDIKGDDRAKIGSVAESANQAVGLAETEKPGAPADARGASANLPEYPEITSGPLPDGRFRFSDHPSAEELRAYAKWDPNIKEEVAEKFHDLARRRARDEAIRDVYDRVQPEPPDLPRAETPRSRAEVARALARFVADTQEAVDYLLALGRNRYNDIGPRIRALTAVTRTGPGAAQLGATIDHLFRAAGALPGKDNAGEDVQ